MPNLEKMKKWIIIAILLVVIISPILVNFFLLRPAIGVVVGKDTDWLVFWGNYLGGVISVLGAFAILWIQRQDNNCQNQANRKANKDENRRNRELQMNILRQQRENQWLDKFRQLGIEYSMAFNPNDLIEVSNAMSKPRDAREILSTLIDKIARCETHLSYFFKRDDEANKLSKELNEYYKIYKQSIVDIQTILVYYINNPDLDERSFYSNVIALQVSDAMKKILNEYNSIKQGSGVRNIIAEIFAKRAKDVEGILNSTRCAIYRYICEEQKRIDAIIEC